MRSLSSFLQSLVRYFYEKFDKFNKDDLEITDLDNINNKYNKYKYKKSSSTNNLLTFENNYLEVK